MIKNRFELFFLSKEPVKANQKFLDYFVMTFRDQTKKVSRILKSSVLALLRKF